MLLQKINAVTWLVKLLLTRLPSNLRPTTCKCMHFVMHGHFWSSDKDGSHTIWLVKAERPHDTCKTHGSIFYRTELWAIKVLHCENRDFRLFLLLWPWPWLNDLNIRIWPVFPGDTTNMQIQLPTSKLSKVIMWYAYTV